MEPNPLAVDQLLAQAGWIQNLARRLVQDEATAQDLTQETLLAALEHRPRSDRSLRPWLARVLRSRSALRARGRAGRVAREREVARAEALPSSEDLAARAETQRGLVDEVLRLDDPYRSLLLLRYYEGLDVAEIARRRDSTPGSVRGQLSRATGLLRERLDAGQQGSDWRLALLPLARAELISTTPLTATAALLGMNVMTKALLAAAALLVGVFFFVSEPLRSAETSASRTPDATFLPALERTGLAELPDGTAESAAPTPVARGARTPITPPTAGPAAAPALSVDRERIAGTLHVRGRAHPLREFLLELYRGDTLLERVTTDARGAFLSAEEHPAGDYRFVARDHPDLDPAEYFAGTRRHERVPDTLDVTWELGTSLALVLDPRLEFDVQLIGPEAAVASIDAVSILSESPDAELDPARMGIRLPVSAGAPLRGDGDARWVRFAHLHVEGGAKRVLRVESEGGLWIGEAPAPLAEELQSGPITFHLEPRGALELTVPWSDAGQPAQMHAALTPLDAASVGGPLTALESAGARTLYATGGLLPGSYRVTAYATGTEPARREIEIRPGEITRVTLELDYPPELHTLRVRVTSETGEFHGLTSFVARVAERRRYGDGLVDWKEEEGAWVGTQELGPMPPGQYELSMMMSLDPVKWRLPAGPVTVPGPLVDVLCLDAEASCTLVMRVLDAETDAPLTRGQVWLSKEDEAGYFGLGQLSSKRDDVQWSDIPVSAEVLWRVEVPGYEKVSGDWSEVPLVGGERRLDVRVTRLP